MAVDNIKIDNREVDKIMCPPYIKPANIEPRVVRTKLTNEGGGYYGQGVSLMPATNNNVYVYYWELGITNGGLKNPNNGARIWGYTDDGYYNLTNGINPTGYASGGFNSIAIMIYAEDKNLDISDSPIVITFREPIFNNTFDIYAGSDCDISSDKKTITIKKVKDNRVGFIRFNTNANFLSNIYNIYGEINGIHKLMNTYIPPYDVTTDQIWKATVGDTIVYERDKTLDSAWKDYNLIIEDSDKISVKLTNRSESDKDRIILPNIKDLDKYLFPKANSGIKPITFNGTFVWDEIGDSFRQLMSTKDIVFVNSNDTTNTSAYTESDNNYKALELGFLSDSNYDGDLTINIDGNNKNIVMLEQFRNCKFGKLIINFKNNTILSVCQFLFKRVKDIKELEIQVNGVKDTTANKYPVDGRDCSGMFEFSGIKEIELNVNWDAYRNLWYGFDYNNIAYMFSYCSSLERINSVGGNIHVINNHQSFQGCSNLKNIPWVLKLEANDSREDTTNNYCLYKFFENCHSLEDVKIHGLNGNYYNFASDSHIGNLKSLNSDSINYMLRNVTDLTKYDSRYSIEGWQNSFIKWELTEQGKYYIDNHDKFKIPNRISAPIKLATITGLGSGGMFDLMDFFCQKDDIVGFYFKFDNGTIDYVTDNGSMPGFRATYTLKDISDKAELYAYPKSTGLGFGTPIESKTSNSLIQIYGSYDIIRAKSLNGTIIMPNDWKGKINKVDYDIAVARKWNPKFADGSTPSFGGGSPSGSLGTPTAIITTTSATITQIFKAPAIISGSNSVSVTVTTTGISNACKLVVYDDNNTILESYNVSGAENEDNVILYTKSDNKNLYVGYIDVNISLAPRTVDVKVWCKANVLGL